MSAGVGQEEFQINPDVKQFYSANVTDSLYTDLMAMVGLIYYDVGNR